MNFSVLAEAFEKMENTTKRLELTDHLVDLFRATPPETISKIVYLIQGKIRPDYEGVELGIAEKLAVRAVSKSSGIQIGKIEDALKKDGDLGRAASGILSQRKQTTFLAQEVTVERVYDTLYKIANLSGSSSQERKIKYISSLLNDANPTEARFMIKLLLGTLRLGVAENTVMDGLAIAFTGEKKNGIFHETESENTKLLPSNYVFMQIYGIFALNYVYCNGTSISSHFHSNYKPCEYTVFFTENVY